MVKIKAAVCHEFGAPLKIETIDLREPTTGEVEVTLGAVAVCHSDISFADGDWGGDLPAVYGHEAAGLVSKIGDTVKGFEIGDRVVVTLIKSCGNCNNCLEGNPTICEASNTAIPPILSSKGITIQQVMNCDLNFETASLLACGVITGIGAVVNAAKLRPGQDAVVIGAGGVGLNAIQGARIAGARRIIAVDTNKDKLVVAREFGATDCVLATEKSPWRIAKSLIGGGADVVFVTVGNSAVYDVAPRYLGYGGKVVMVGMPKSGDKSTYEPVMMASVSQGMIGSKMGDVVIKRDIPWMVDLYNQGRIKLDELVSKTWSLEQINEAIADTKLGSAKRNVIVFDTGK
jgi:Zn-dependent alcohol dehydrogenase